MVRRTTRSPGPSDPARVVRALRSCRDEMVKVHTEVKPMGPVYHAASMVMAAVDAFATLLTGQRYYFWADGLSPGEERRQLNDDRRAREEGDEPWEP